MGGTRLYPQGYHLGQFSMVYDKRTPYEHDVRIPYMVRLAPRWRFSGLSTP
jgi:hypothetical protein